MFLQLIGVILVGIGLRDTRQAFNDLPTTLGAIKQWWFGRPRFRPQHHVIQAAAGSFATSFGAARTHVSIGPNTPLEHRMTILEQQYVSLFDEVGTLSTEMKKRTDELSNALEVERSERQRADNTTHDQLRKAVAEGIPLGSVGVILFLLGIAAGSRNCVDI